MVLWWLPIGPQRPLRALSVSVRVMLLPFAPHDAVAALPFSPSHR